MDNQNIKFIPNIWITGEVDGLKIVGRTFEDFGLELVACINEEAKTAIMPIEAISNIRNLTFVKPEDDANAFFGNKTKQRITSILSEDNRNKITDYLKSRFNEYMAKIGDKTIPLKIDRERVRKVHSYQEAKQILGPYHSYFFISIN